MTDVEKARKELEKVNTLLLNRFGYESQVMGHLARAIRYLLPDEAEPTSNPSEVAVVPEPEIEEPTVTIQAEEEAVSAPPPPPAPPPDVPRKTTYRRR